MKVLFAKKSRIKVLSVATVIGFGLVVAQLFNLQIINHQTYVDWARAEQVKKLVIPAKRGLIYAMDGDQPVALVLNQNVYTLFVDPQVVTDTKKLQTILEKEVGGLLVDDYRDRLQADNRYQVLARGLSRAQANKIKDERLTGVGFQEVSQRVYPENELAAQVLGFVNSEGGQYGIEEGLNKRLAGEDGLLESVTDIAQVPLTLGEQNINQPARDGENIVLTIDRNIQTYTEKALKNGLSKHNLKFGSVLVLDPQTGKVLAMANQPTYNPAEFYKVDDAAKFVNKTVFAPYEPGSVIKTLTMTAGLDRGVISPTSTYSNTDRVQVNDRTIYNALRGYTGQVSMQKALTYSLNTGMVHVLAQLGGGQINHQARTGLFDYFHNKFGLGEPTGIEVGEASGKIFAPSDQEGNAVRYSNMAFGQGMDLTMVQVAAAFGASINGGNYYRPTLVNGTVDRLGHFEAVEFKPTRPNIIKSETSQSVRSMVNTARRDFYAKIDKEGFEVGGKTGTSETIRNGVYVKDETIASYLGYGGNSQPRYVIMIQVSSPGRSLEGAVHAMPIFTDISNWLIDYLKLQPKG